MTTVNYIFSCCIEIGTGIANRYTVIFLLFENEKSLKFLNCLVYNIIIKYLFKKYNV